MNRLAPNLSLRPLVECVQPPARVPGATYRLQFHASFTFEDARRLVPYVAALGVTDLYASPYLRARSGSSHGYDVADPNSLNPEIGTEEDYSRLVEDLRRYGMGHILDIVPNHMGVGDSGNVWWLDVLENGPSSVYAGFFDINWSPMKPDVEDKGKVVLPILGDQYGCVIENGELVLAYADGAFFVDYYGFRLPVAPESYAWLLTLALEHIRPMLGKDHELVWEIESVITAVGHLPPRSERDPEKLRERNREKEIVKRRIARMYEQHPEFQSAIEASLKVFRGTPGDCHSFDPLDRLLDQQAYRLAFWRVAAEEINYRRFFDVSELAAVRMEDPKVFQETHRLLLRLVGEGKITGLRIDHPDGLWDPAGYLRRLQKHCFATLHAARSRASNQQDGLASSERLESALLQLFEEEWRRNPDSPLVKPMYVVVEKILTAGERLSSTWPVHGTTGYEFLNALNGIFVSRANRAPMDRIYTRFTRSSRCREVIIAAKKMIMLISLPSEINELGYELKRIAGKNRRFRDFTLNGLTFAIREVIAALPVYRTYIVPHDGRVGERDWASVESAVREAKRRNPRTDPSIFDFVRDTLLLTRASGISAEDRAEELRFVARFQQATGPVMAKGVEDTAFYIYNRLVSLNEVGGDPDQFGVSMTAFHRQNLERLRNWPAGLLATSTHDTKRSEDVRARINVLSELPREWGAALTRWSRSNDWKKSVVDGRPAPDRNEEYLLYQTLLGAWPLQPMEGDRYDEFRERIAAHMLKAIREAKVNTSWISPNAEYEAAAQDFTRLILDNSDRNPFLDDFRVLRETVAHFGIFNSLSQTLLKITSPGVPDIYQGNDLWDFSLVDPDNRRPVDFDERVRALRSIEEQIRQGDRHLAEFVEELLASKEDGRIKLYLTHRALSFRKDHPDLFLSGSYLPLRAHGSKKAHVCAFARADSRDTVVVAVPVLVATLNRGALIPPLGEEVWGDSWVTVPGEPGSRYRNLLTGEVVATSSSKGKATLSLSALLTRFPAALLEAVA